MKEYEYKCVPVPHQITVGRKDLHSDALDAYEEIINNGASGGWQLDSIDSIITKIPGGCLPGLIGKSESIVENKILIYKRELL